MPVYKFQCFECGLRFDARTSMESSTKDRTCPGCSEMAKRLMPESASGHFNQKVNGPVPQNTGIHDLDTHIDRVIGQSAAQGWGVAEERVADKRRVLADNPTATGHDLSRIPEGGYEVLAPEERGVYDRAQAINSLAMSSFSERRRKKLPAR